MKRFGVPVELFLIAVAGPTFYLALWLMVLPLVADFSARLAVLLLALFTSAYCFAVGHRRGLNAALWGAIGLLAGLLELGLVPVLLVGLIRSKRSLIATPGPATGE